MSVMGTAPPCGRCSLVRASSRMLPRPVRTSRCRRRGHAITTGPRIGQDAGVDALDLASITRTLAGAGCVAAAEEAAELLDASRGRDDLRRMVTRRLTGEPLAWITGTT